MSPDREARRDQLFDLLVSRPDGITVEDIQTELECTYGAARRAIRDLRLLLGDVDSINVPADPQRQNERWLYRLVGSMDEVRAWISNRLGDTESRLRTMTSMMESIVQATDGRSLAGRRARLIERALRHLVEDLDALIAESAA